MLKTRNILLSDRMMALDAEALDSEAYRLDDSSYYTYGSGGGGGAVTQTYEDERVLTPVPDYYNPDIATIDPFDIGFAENALKAVEKALSGNISALSVDEKAILESFKDVNPTWLNITADNNDSKSWIDYAKIDTIKLGEILGTNQVTDTTNAIIQKNDVGGIVDVMKPTTTPIPLDSLKNNLGLGTGTTTTPTTAETVTAAATGAVTDNKKYYIIAVVIAIILAVLLIK